MTMHYLLLLMLLLCYSPVWAGGSAPTAADSSDEAEGLSMLNEEAEASEREEAPAPNWAVYRYVAASPDVPLHTSVLELGARLDATPILGKANPNKQNMRANNRPPVCEPNRRLRHRHTAACAQAPPRPPRHRRTDSWACGPTRPVRHSRLASRLSCPPIAIRHTPTDRYRVQCNPNQGTEPTAMEILAKRVRYLFTNHRRNCDLMPIYATISVGDVITLENGDRAVVMSYEMETRRTQYLKYKNEQDEKGKLKTRKFRSIRHLVVLRQHGDRQAISGDGITFSRAEKVSYTLRQMTLTSDETKRIIIQRAVQLGYADYIYRIYPEERKNYYQWVMRYAPKRKGATTPRRGGPALPGSSE